MAEAGPW